MTLKELKDWIDGERELFDFDVAPRIRKQERREYSKPELSGLMIKSISILSAAVLFAVLLWVVYTMPLFGTGAATDNELSRRYVEQGMYEVGAKNLVANMLFVYRGFDTFGEATVLFAAASSVIFLLSDFDTKPREELRRQTNPILADVVRMMFPFALVFGVYILLNGHLSPGGGFSGGSVLGAAMILLDISLGQGTVSRFFNHSVYTFIKVGALLIYGVIILYLVLCGANAIANGIPLGTAGNIFSAGIILPVNLMVGFEVACTMYAFFTYFYRGELK